MAVIAVVAVSIISNQRKSSSFEINSYAADTVTMMSLEADGARGDIEQEKCA